MSCRSQNSANDEQVARQEDAHHRAQQNQHLRDEVALARDAYDRQRAAD